MPCFLPSHELYIVLQLDSVWDVIDVGALVPPHLQGFFEKCQFGPDSEGSICMMIDIDSFSKARKGS